MKLSDWQLMRLRNAIRAYHRYESSHDGDPFTWKDVSEAIDEYTGVAVPPERLRQFVEGVKQKDGDVTFPVPKGDRLRAIHQFALDPEVGLLSEDELTERTFDVQAALRLLEYLDQDFDRTRIAPPSTISGRYYYWRPEPPFISVTELILAKPFENGVVQTHLTERFYAETDAPDKDAVLASGLGGEFKSEARYGGWSILTPEDNFFTFLKEEGVGRNRYYFTLASDLDHGAPIPITNLSLLLHDYPLESEDGGAFADFGGDEIAAAVARNHQNFARIKGA